MFTFSFDWLQRISDFKLDYRDTLESLNLQGLEVKKITEIGKDRAVTIEVKANRPDCLYHLGLLREVAAHHEKAVPKLQSAFHLPVDNKAFPYKIAIKDKKLCRRFASIVIHGIDNSKPTPAYIRAGLETVGVNVINPVVDILNYVMLTVGQPMHAYDCAKLKSNTVSVETARGGETFTTLNGEEVTIPEEAILIKDKDEILSAAGIIGGLSSGCDENTTDILLECANFDEVAVRLASRRMKTSTASSFRFERGVDRTNIPNALGLAVELIHDTCGGTPEPVMADYDEVPHEPQYLRLRVERCNALLGVELGQMEMKKLLERYDYASVKEDGVLIVDVPSYRLDIEQEVDLIEEVARTYGYHNIKPTYPVLPAHFNQNRTWQICDTLRTLMCGAGFDEMINYAFIPHDSMAILKLEENHPLFSDAVLENPITQDHALMRPSLVYSLMQSVAYNFSVGNKNLSLFEVGRRYLHDKKTDTGFDERDTLGVIFNGHKLAGGFGVNKPVPYDFYDIGNLLQIIFQEMNMPFALTQQEMPFFMPGTGCTISSGDTPIGFAGQIEDSCWQGLPNGKLVREPVYYFEIDIASLTPTHKTLQFSSRYPGIVREYNLLMPKTQQAQEVLDTISGASPLVQQASVHDLYEGKGVPQGQKSLLVQVKFASDERTLTSEEIEKIEQDFYSKLQKMAVQLKG